MADRIRDFFSPEAGQRRRSWLNEVEGKAADAMRYYLGPDLFPPVNALANGVAMVSPGADVQDAYTASGELMQPDRSLLDRAASGAALAGSLGAMFMPGGVSSIRQGIDDLADAGVRAVRSPTLGSNAGNLAADAATETPAQQIARLLREGRAEEVTDDMLGALSPNDSMELIRLYEVGATGADMPMDTASRMARAEGMGFDTGTPLYHGTGSDFQAFDPARFGQSDHGAKGRGVYSSQDPDLASSYATLVAEDGRQVYPLFYGLRNAYSGEIPMAMYDEGRSVAFTNSLRNAGFDGVMRPNQRRGGEITEAVAFDPSQVRSRFARFDPRLAHLSNLNAGVAGAAALGAGALAMQPGQAEAQPAAVGNLLFQQEQAKRIRDYLGGVQ